MVDVITSYSIHYTKLYDCLDPSMPIRNELLASIIEASSPYDGVQIDFELVPASDAEQFYSFLSVV